MLCAIRAVLSEGYSNGHMVTFTGASSCSFVTFCMIGHAKLEVVTKLALPEPELQFSTNGDTSKGVVIGMGDVNIGIEEFNLLLEY